MIESVPQKPNIRYKINKPEFNIQYGTIVTNLYCVWSSVYKQTRKRAAVITIQYVFYYCTGTALHEADPTLIPNIPYGPQSTARDNSWVQSYD